MKIRINIKWPLHLPDAEAVRLAYILLGNNGREFEVLPDPSGNYIAVTDIENNIHQVGLDWLNEKWWYQVPDSFRIWRANQDWPSGQDRTFTEAGMRSLWDEAREDLKHDLFEKMKDHPGISSTVYRYIGDLLENV